MSAPRPQKAQLETGFEMLSLHGNLRLLRIKLDKPNTVLHIVVKVELVEFNNVVLS